MARLFLMKIARSLCHRCAMPDSPKVGGLGIPRKVLGFAKGSPFEERLPPLRGKMSPQVTKGGICQSRQALTERARTLRDQREQTEGVFPGRQALTEGVPL